MTASNSGQPWLRRAASASSLVAAMAQDDDVIEDLVALTGEHTPPWVRALPIPPGWDLVALRDTDPAAAPSRIAVRGPRPEGGWEATDTLNVFGYTGTPRFSDVLRSTTAALIDLDAEQVTTRVLPLPRTGPGVAAVRSTGTLIIEGRAVWTQHTNYVAGSALPRAGRLLVHDVFAGTEQRSRLAADTAALTQSVQDAFAMLVDASGAHG